MKPRSSTETIAAAMAANHLDPPAQLAQTRFRQDLVAAWAIPSGASVLEIGCGQGDTTAVLADAVGENGRVVAVDIADPGYGTPVTLGESAAFLLSTPLGSRVEFHFSFDVLANSFPANHFDYAVFAHCGWYFPSLHHIQRVLTHLRLWARHLRLSEWDLTLRTPAQLPHLLAVLLQAHFEAYTPGNEGNVRTPFSRHTLDRILTAAGWTVSSDHSIDTASLRDADWEIHNCLTMAANPALLTPIPGHVQDLITTQLDLLRATAHPDANTPLPSYTLNASASP